MTTSGSDGLFPVEIGFDEPGYVLEDLVPLERIQSLLEAHYSIVQIPLGLVTPDNRVILAIGWQPICQQFHRMHPESERRCIESNADIQRRLFSENTAASKCMNGLWDIAMPVMVGERHLATMFIGQFLYEDESVDEAFFVDQAMRYGYDCEAYLNALRLVPRITRDRAAQIVDYIAGMVALLADLGQNNMQLAREIEERRLAEYALQESERQYRALIENVPGAVFLCLNDDQYTTIFISDVFEDITGRPSSTMINEMTSIMALIHPHDQPMVRQRVDEAVQAQRPYVVNYRIQCKDGGYTWVEERGQGVWDDTNCLRFLQGVMFDISERRRADEERRKLEAEVARAHKLESLAVLAGGIAHDFNNLLVGILGSADLALVDMSPDNPHHGNLQDIVQAGRRAADLTRQMLAYSGRGHFVVESLELGPFVRSLEQDIRASLPETFTVEYHLNADAAPISADESQLKQVLLSLVANAAESYGGQGGTVTISVASAMCDKRYIESLYHGGAMVEGRYTYLEVRDTGCGMDEDTLRRLCDPFFSTKFTGRGLGMAAVLGIVRGHKAMLSVESAPKEGTAIRLLFPATMRQYVLEGRIEQECPPAKTQYVLLVDDEAIIRHVAQKMLTRAGYSVLLAAGGWEAIKLLEQHGDDISCVILDLTMPHMDGGETLSAIRDRCHDIPVILSSGYRQEDVIHKLQPHSISAFLQKPYKMSALVQVLSHILAE